MKKVRGRPFIPEEDRRRLIYHLRLNPQEKAVLQAKAKKAGKPLSEWIRKSLIESE